MKLIRADIFRLFRSKGFYISIGLLLLFSIFQVANGAMYLGVIYNDMIGVYTSQSMLFDLVSVADNLIYFFIPIIVIILSKDFSRRTVANFLISGGSRKKYFTGKLSLIIMMASALFLFYYIFAILCYLMLSRPLFSGKDGFGDFLGAILLQWVTLTAYTCFAVMLATLSKNALATVIGCILMCYLPAGFSGMIGSALPNVYSVLQRFDLVKNIRMAAYIQTLTPQDIIIMLIISIMYIIVFSLIGFISMKRSNIK